MGRRTAQWNRMALLYAAASSPGCAHRAPSVKAALDLGNRRPLVKGDTAARALEHELSIAVTTQVAAIERHIAPVSDPSIVVHLRGENGSAWRVHPGTYDDPLHTLDALGGLSSLDDALSEVMGYGFSDLFDIALIGMHVQLEVLAPHWSWRAVGKPDAPVAIADAEVDAAERLVGDGPACLDGMPDWVGRCRRPDAVAVALASLTASPAGGGLTTTVGGRAVLLPAGFLVPAINEAAAIHLAHLSHSADVTELLGAVARRGLAEWLASQSLPVTCDDPARAPFVAHVGQRHAMRFDPDGRMSPGESDGVVDVVVTALADAPYEPTTPPMVALPELVRLRRHAEWDELYRFFDVLGRQRPLPRARSVVDLLVLWSMAGSLDPVDVGASAPIVVDHAWPDAGRWEAFDALLQTLGMPPSRRWGCRELRDPDGSEAVLRGGLPPVQLQARLDPAVAVIVEVAPDCPDLRLLLMLADSLCLRAKDRGLRELIERVAGTYGLLIRVTVVSVDTATDDADNGCMRVGVAAAPASGNRPAVWSLEFDNSIVLAHAFDASGAHRAVGELLLHAAEECVPLESAFADQFRSGWATQPPLLVAAATTTVGADIPLDPPLLDRDPKLPASVAGLAARASGVGDGTLTGDAAVDFVVAVYCPALLDELRHRLARFDRTDVIRFTAFQLEQTVRWRVQLEQAALLAHHAPWETDIDAVTLVDAGRHLRVLHLLLELEVMTESHEGAPCADHIEWKELVSLADALLFAAIAADYARNGLSELEALVAGPFAVVRSGQHGGPDLATYRAARAAHHQRPGRFDPAETTRAALEAGVGDEEFRPVASVEAPPALLGIDAALRETLGTGIDGITAVLGTAATWDVTREEPAAAVERDALLSEAVAWSGVDADAVNAALELLTFDPIRASSVLHNYWRLEERRYRLAARPFVPAAGDRVWVMPGAVRALQILLLTYFGDGRLPWPDLGTPVERATRAFRKSLETAHEGRVVAICRELGFAVWPGLKPHKARALGVDWPDTIGEFDVLAADVDSRRLWVLEAKNAVNAVSGWHLKDAVEDFHGPVGHVAKLLRRVGAVKEHAAAAVELLLKCPPGEWTVLGAMVTVDVEVAAFTRDPRVPFVVVDDLRDMLSSDGPFPAGHWPVGLS
jgi:hypothetical protein